MSPTAEKLIQAALALPAAERMEVADRLIESLSELARSDEWSTEISRRLEEFRSGKVQSIPGEDVMLEARKIASGEI